MLKKVLVVFSTIGCILGTTAIIDYMVDDVHIYDDIISIFEKEEEEPEFNIETVKSFNPMEVNGKLKGTEYTGDTLFTRLSYGKDIVNIPLPSADILTNYSDTVFANDGSFYCVLSKGKEYDLDTKEVTLLKHNLGRNKPVVLEFKIPNTDTVLYIQCYTNEALGFYENLEKDKIEYWKSDFDFNEPDENIASYIEIPEEIIVPKENSYLDKDYVEIVSNYRDSYEGYSEFFNYNDKKFNYYRAVGLLDMRMEVEYARMRALGYTVREIGTYKDLRYIKFDGITIIGSNITNNSYLIYHIEG